jgi:integrase
MSDIRKRTGSKGTTYQVRYANKAAKSGYAYATFETLKEARNFREDAKARKREGARSSEIKSVEQAVDKWLVICETEGTDRNDPVTDYTLKDYRERAEKMKSYEWNKHLHQLEAPDIVEFRSWLLATYTRDQAAKVLGSFHSVIKEMSLRGIVASNVAAGISVSRASRYDQPIVIPSARDVQALLAAADRLAKSKNKKIADAWKRYRPMLYLAVDTGMRPQEYLALPRYNLGDNEVKVDRAIERGGEISVTKTPAGWRWIDWSPATRDLVTHYADHHAADSKYDLVFPTASGHWQSLENWCHRGFHAACIEAGLVEKFDDKNGKTAERPKYRPYDLRHFYASMLIEQRTNLKRIQNLMGHKNIETTLNTYGHLIERAETSGEKQNGMLAKLLEMSCGKSVAHAE